MRRNKRELTHPWNASDLKEYFRYHIYTQSCVFQKKSTIRYAVQMGGIEIATISRVRVLFLC